MWHYFYHPLEEEVNSLEELDSLLDSDRAKWVMAFNGWVMTDNPLRNFAEDSCCVYLRRELIVWGDSVKLRYGRRLEVCPYLWDRMAQYVELTASIFHAVRLDNCHSTPLHVAQYFLDRARSVRPNLYIVAELFTGSEHLDNIFINKLGINSLIREGLQAGDVRQLSGLLHRCGAHLPAGAFSNQPEFTLRPSLAHALLYDQTHDNEAPAVKRSCRDYLPSAGLVSMTLSAMGSTRGYDEMVPHHINVVTEERLYIPYAQEKFMQPRAILNKLHQRLSHDNFVHSFVSHNFNDVIVFSRFSPDTGDSVVLIAHSCFGDRGLSPDCHDHGQSPIKLNGVVTQVILQARTEFSEEVQKCFANEWQLKQALAKDPHLINGLVGQALFPYKDHLKVQDSQFFSIRKVPVHEGVDDEIILTDFPPGALLVLQVSLNPQQRKAFEHIMANIRLQRLYRFLLIGLTRVLASNVLLFQFDSQLRSTSCGQAVIALHRRESIVTETEEESAHEDGLEARVLNRIGMQLSLVELSWALFRCDLEAAWHGNREKCDSCYDVPRFGAFVYAGFQGIVSVLDQVRMDQDMGHPLCDNLRNGYWLPDFLAHRLQSTPDLPESALIQPGTALDRFGKACETLYNPLKLIPDYLRPSLFDLVTSSIHKLLVRCALSRMPQWVREANDKVQRLCVASLQMYGRVGNARLPPLHAPDEQEVILQNCSIAAGLPHFAEGMWRSWGRDTFIALPGILLLSGRYKRRLRGMNNLQEACCVILQYAGLMRHGLVPNLSGDGATVSPRFNCRDAVWYWLHSICLYEEAVLNQRVGQGLQEASPIQSIMHRQVAIYFPSDDPATALWPPNQHRAPTTPTTKPLYELVLDVLQRHWDGIDFLEHNAGSAIDEHMRQEGFRVSITRPWINRPTHNITSQKHSADSITSTCLYNNASILCRSMV
ncbi:hypothetical protein Ciccas_002999 [Cichlidogyrus casuarinus]|uniref:Glycogen debranching enzyme n=1 Tax=Cichlidogyrus casuarinus TaxID=1844966 RepID=A0ABD2QGL0_9PLAT